MQLIQGVGDIKRAVGAEKELLFVSVKRWVGNHGERKQELVLMVDGLGFR